MRGGFAAGAAVPGIIRRRLQTGARAHAALAAIDRGIEQFRKRRPDRLHFRTVGFGFRGFGLLGSVGILRHGPEYGAETADIKDLLVMAGLVPAIHVFLGGLGVKTWMPGTRPGMTKS